MLSPAEFRALSDRAFDDADDYRVAAETAPEPRRSMLLKFAAQRDDDGEFYWNRAAINEAFEAARSKPEQMEAA